VVLDAGCGPAGIFLLPEGAATDAFDPLLEEYERLLPHFCRSDFPRVRFFQATLEDFASDRPYYDLVFCLNAINHVADIGRSMDRLVTLTRPGGRLVISVDAHNHGWLKWLFRRFPGDLLHPHQYDLSEYTAMLTGRGCSVERVVVHKREWIFSYCVVVASTQQSNDFSILNIGMPSLITL
jgi:2-polyprenyl-6-hydroxyphenyl methylase/3-demethylubiquinone-9 3-methyltransferase